MDATAWTIIVAALFLGALGIVMILCGAASIANEYNDCIMERLKKMEEENGKRE